METNQNPANPQASQQAEVYHAYCHAVRNADFAAMRQQMIPQMAALMDAPVFPQRFPLMQAMLPADWEAVALEEEGDEAKLTLSGKGIHEGHTGTVFLHRLEGQWRIAGETWGVAESPQP